MTRQKVNTVSSQSRTATGVVIQKVEDGDYISSVSVAPTFEEKDD